MRSWPTAAALALLLAACPPADPHVALGMSDSTFVHTMVRLKQVAADSTIDELARDSSRKLVLRENNVTAGQMDAAARLLAQEPLRAESLWVRIERQAKPRNAASP